MGFMGGGWMMILWIGVLVLAIVFIAKMAAAPKKNLLFTNDAQSILAKRYAKGEITREEFNMIKKELK